MAGLVKAICAIADISGLYISDLTVPSSTELLQAHGITHVLSLTNLKYRPSLDEKLGIKHLHFAIDDNPFEDLLMALEGLCAWIESALEDGNNAKVLIHCIEGISRSGAIAVAMLMRNHELDYEAALQLAQTSRRVILPNSGFADQLRLWAGMRYSVLEIGDSGVWTEKQAYEHWRTNRGVLLSKEEMTKQDLRRKDMANMVVKFRRREVGPEQPLPSEKSEGVANADEELVPDCHSSA